MIIELDKDHNYKVDGVSVPSRSEIIGYFFRDQYMPPQHILDYAAQKGTAIHKAIELYENDDLGHLPVWLEPYLEQWKLFRKCHGNIVLIEKRLYSKKYHFCGTIDLIFSHGLLPDIKSGQKSIKHQLQTAMYSMLANENNIPVMSRGCLYIKEDSFKFELHEDDDDFKLVEAMIKIYHWSCENKLIKVNAPPTL